MNGLCQGTRVTWIVKKDIGKYGRAISEVSAIGNNGIDGASESNREKDDTIHS